jgi:NAD(P)-dependent dehydrogenase (short-subunit alcohol dehydrogenase family)
VIVVARALGVLQALLLVVARLLPILTPIVRPVVRVLLNLLAPIGAVAALVVAVRMLAARIFPRRELDLGDAVVLITGGSRGLGLAMAEEFALQGVRGLILCARGEADLLAAQDRVGRLGVPVLTVRCDVSRPDEVGHLADRAYEHFGRVDVLVNNAGMISVGPLESQSLGDFEQAMDIMYWGVLHPTLAVLPRMKERGSGRIVNITSIGGKISVPHLLPYNASKFAAVGLSEGLRAELAKDGILVTTIVPGLMRTGSHVNALFKGRHRLEFMWFSLGASLPFTSIDIRSAAKQVIRAVRRGDAELIITPQAQAMARMTGAFPGLMSQAMATVNRMLPPGDGRERIPGRESHTPVSKSFLTSLGERAARRYQHVDRN